MRDGTIFRLADISFSYLGRYPALCGIDMDISHGEKICVIGANGTGKSTLLQMLDGLVFPDEGTITAFGKELSEERFNNLDFSRTFRKKVGLVFQNPDVQLFCPTVKEDIIFGPLQLGMKESETQKKLDEIVSLLEIGHLLDRSPHQLSIGEKRKVAIASTLAIDPQVLIFDEPTAGLDPQTTRHIIDFIIHANESGKTIITATHDLHIVEEIADTVYVFGNGKSIVRHGPTAELLSDIDFLKEHNLIHLHSHSHKGKVHTHVHKHLEHHR